MSEEKKSKIDTNRRDMPKQSPEMRRYNFNEVAFGYTEELAIAEASRCLQCKKPRCKTGCPVEIDIPDFISFIVKRDFRGGIRKLKERTASLRSVEGYAPRKASVKPNVY
ncbi:MAG: gltD [Deltaproteobacteria bacterium]|nr:gltD [Deltaproteobacteria bacterium]